MQPVFLFKIYLFGRHGGKEGEIFLLLVHPKTPTTVSAGLGSRQEPGAPSGVPMSVARVQVLGQGAGLELNLAPWYGVAV